MELRIEPSSELTLKLKDKKIGRLEALCLDVSSSASMFISVPKVKLSISVNASAFENDQSTLKTLVDKLSKFKFLDIVIKK